MQVHVVVRSRLVSSTVGEVRAWSMTDGGSWPLSSHQLPAELLAEGRAHRGATLSNGYHVSNMNIRVSVYRHETDSAAVE